MRTDYLDCCDQPALEVVRTLYQASHDLEALMRCARCQTPWFYRFHEYVTFVGPDDLTSWFTRLNDEEAERLQAAEDGTAVDLDFLETRPSWMHDDRGPRQVPSRAIPGAEDDAGSGPTATVTGSAGS
jgi:hypothetical protein